MEILVKYIFAPIKLSTWRVLLVSAIVICFGSVPFSVKSQSLKEASYVSIGGIDQWITIIGEDKSLPAILFIHGGPGSVMSPWAASTFSGWEKDFVMANWDQRGAGKTFGRNAPSEVDEDYWIENPLELDQMVADGIEVATYVLKRLDKQKIILFGTSWGSILATKMAQERPDLFIAYVGHAQFVNFEQSIKHAYHRTVELAHTAGDTLSLNKLASLGVPPYLHPQNLGQLLRIVKQYEQLNASPLPNHWKIASQYDHEEDEKSRFNGDDYSFLYLAGYQKLGIKSLTDGLDFYNEGLRIQIPVFLVQGEHDILTPKEINKPYFDKIIAPEKGYFTVPNAAHGFNQAVIDKIHQVIKERVAKN